MSARPKRSGGARLYRSGRAGLARRGALLARGTQQPAHAGPGERPGARLSRASASGLSGCGHGQWDPAAGRICWQRAPALGTFPARARALLAPCGDQAAPREGAAPHAWPRDWAPPCLVSEAPAAGTATSADSGPRVQNPRRSRAPPEIGPRQPQPTPCRRTPYPSLAEGARDAGERPHAGPSPQPCALGTRLSSATHPKLS